jgi:hypothetical protein
MIYCPGCGTANREGSRYCNQCGAPLTGDAIITCPRCGTANAPEAGHCQACGLDMARAREQDEAEQAGLTVFSSDEAEAGEGGPDAEEVADILHAGGLPPWLDAVEWPTEEQASWSGADDDEELLDEDFDVRSGRTEWTADAIPIEPIVGVPYRARERHEPSLTPEQQAAAELFASVAAEEVRAAATDVAAPPGLPALELGLRWLASAALLVAVLVPLLWPHTLFSAAGPLPAGVAAAREAVRTLPPGSTVLVAFDYDAGLAGEMQPIAEALLHDLLGRGLHVLTVSTLPEGATLADMALDRAMQGHANARYGQSVLNLGYVAGGEAAVRALAGGLLAAAPVDHRAALPLGRYPVAVGLRGAKDLPLVVVLARDPVGLQRWIEQAATPYGTPLVAGVPALAEPAVTPYQAAGQLRGVVAGLAGAAAYERLTGFPGVGVQTMGAVRLGAWVLGFLVVLVNAAALLRRLRRR